MPLNGSSELTLSAHRRPNVRIGIPPPGFQGPLEITIRTMETTLDDRSPHEQDAWP